MKHCFALQLINSFQIMNPYLIEAFCKSPNKKKNI